MLENVQGSLNPPPSGSYSVRASEIARHKALSCIRVQVVFLDDTAQVFELQKRAKGQTLLDLVFKELELIEKDYFGLQYSIPYQASDQPKTWLDPEKSVKKQLRVQTKSIGTLGVPTLYFRVKFWVSEPSKLTEEFTRYMFVIQLRNDILSGQLPVSQTTAALLASYVVQAELGDYKALKHGTNYLNNFELTPNQTSDVLKKIMELHKLQRGQSPADAEFLFLDHAKRIELYGVDLHAAKDSSQRDIAIGVTSRGLSVMQKNVIINSFSWAKISKVSFKRKQFFIQLKQALSESYDSLLGFNLGSYRACKSLWKSCVEHHTFFRLHEPTLSSKRRMLALSLGSKFRYSGRTEYQALEECRKKPFTNTRFVRSPSRLFLTQSVPSLLEHSPALLKSASVCGPTAKTRLEPSAIFKGRGEITTTPSKLRSDTGYKVTSLERSKLPKLAWIDVEESISTNEESNGVNGALNTKDLDTATAFPFTKTSHTTSVITPAPTPAQSLPDTTSQLNSLTSSPVSDDSVQGLVVIRISSDEAGKFGFNVKGGSDQKQPVLVSKVAPGTPADQCYPRLNEGDQVLYINGIEVEGLSHTEVVNAIRKPQDGVAKSVILKVKQNVYEPEGLDEPAFQYVPETLPERGTHDSGLRGDSAPADALDESILLLSEALASGSLIAQFEQLYRRKPGLSVLESRKPENDKKNRYRDISPYDSTRVILREAASGDYINASHVVMHVPKSATVNRYIASQGPLSQTCGDFWFMIWEQNSTLVVMLTTVVEQGRIKCHRYWPKLFDSIDFGPLNILCSKETETPGFAFREFILSNSQTKEERFVTHMQYLSWPDHGVPDDSSDFLDFVAKVRNARKDMTSPTIVHCSAGIGRTGVLILMETVQCLIEANQPVYPLELVKIMRDQRAMMIQTSSQYRFVCEAILKVFNDKLIQPLQEYR